MDRQTQSPFFALPAELRNQIYKYTFESSVVDLECDVNLASHGGGLIFACRQAHIEAIGLYYSLSTFKFPSYEATSGWVTGTVPKQYAVLVKKFVVRITSMQYSRFLLHMKEEDWPANCGGNEPLNALYAQRLTNAANENDVELEDVEVVVTPLWAPRSTNEEKD